MESDTSQGLYESGVIQINKCITDWSHKLKHNIPFIIERLLESYIIGRKIIFQEGDFACDSQSVKADGPQDLIL